MSAGTATVINVLAILFDGVLVRGGEWHCDKGEATSPWCQRAQASILVLVQVNEEGRQAEGEEEQSLEAAPGRAEAGPGQEAEEVCRGSAESFLVHVTA